jgi:IMP dehydrogenase
MDPIVLSPNHRIDDIDRIKQQYHFSGIPITEDGKLYSKLVGIVTNRDIDFEKDRGQKLSDVMTTDVLTAPKGISLSDANKTLRRSKKGKLPIVDEEGCLVALMSRNDLLTNKEFPFASKDGQKQLMVGAAISTQEEAKERLDALVKAGVDVVIIDAAQVWDRGQSVSPRPQWHAGDLRQQRSINVRNMRNNMGFLLSLTEGLLILDILPKPLLLEPQRR